MPRIASHHLPGGWRSAGANAYTPVCTWPDDCLVQWGARGLVFGKTGARTTAFFEAFPTEQDTFIRGEGETLAQAESDAYAKFERQRNCAAHDFERGSHRNGAGTCRHCGLFKPDAFEPLETCVVCGRPTYFTYGVDAQGGQHWYCEAHESLRCRQTHPSPVDQLLDDEDPC